MKALYIFLYCDTNNHRWYRTLAYTFSIAASHLVGNILNRNMIQTSTKSFQNYTSPVTPQLSEISRISAFGERQRAMGELSKIMSSGQREVNFSWMSKSEWKKKRGRLRCGRRTHSKLGWKITASPAPTSVEEFFYNRSSISDVSGSSSKT